MSKLIELMLAADVQWPVGAKWAVQDADGKVKFSERDAAPKLMQSGVWVRGNGRLLLEHLDRKLHGLSEDWDTAIISRDEYQAAGGWMDDVCYSVRDINNETHNEWKPLRSAVMAPVSRIIEGANLDLPSDTTVDQLCKVLSEQVEAYSELNVADCELLERIAEHCGCDRDGILEALEDDNRAAVRDVNRICKALGVWSVSDALERIAQLGRDRERHAGIEPTDIPLVQLVGRAQRLNTIYHGGELYRHALILLQTEQTLVWCCDGAEYCCKPRQALINPDDNGLAAAILARLCGADVAPEHVAEMREQMGWN